MHEISAGQLADETGVSIRQIQFWTDATVLHALPESDRQGRGRHRVYLANPPWHGERAFCLIAAELNRMNLPVGAMKRVIDFFRRLIGPTDEPPRGGWEKSMSMHPVGSALLGGLSVAIIRPDGGAWSVVKFKPAEKLPRRRATWTVQELIAAGIPTTAAVAIYEGVTAEIPGSFMVEESSGYCLNLTRVLAPLAAIS